jgi:hypothetical protein
MLQSHIAYVLDRKFVGHQWLFWSTLRVHVLQVSFFRIFSQIYLKKNKNTHVFFFYFLWKKQKAKLTLWVLVGMCGNWAGSIRCHDDVSPTEKSRMSRPLDVAFLTDVPTLDSIEVLVMTSQFWLRCLTQYICEMYTWLRLYIESYIPYPGIRSTCPKGLGHIVQGRIV